MKSYKEMIELENKNLRAVDRSLCETYIPIDGITKSNLHPCFGDNAHKFARMHIPVAPKCNITCNYCSRKYDCANESRPGVTSEILSPKEALEKFKLVKSKMKNLTVVGIAGPGDALANFQEVRKSLMLIKEDSPETIFCLSTNGLMLPVYANELIKLGVSHITVTINAVDKKIGAKIYKEVNYLGQKYVGEEGAEILLDNQIKGLRYLCSSGMVCKVNVVMIKGINDKHIKEVVKKVKECGAYMTNIMQMIPVPESRFEHLPLVSNVELNEMRRECEVDIKQMYHCRQCRADAIGTLSQDCSIDFRNAGCEICENKYSAREEKQNIKRNLYKTKKYKFAISSKSGINIDQHFGHADEFYIYSYDSGTIKFLEKRDINKYCTGIEECDEHDNKILRIIKTIRDCDAVLVLRIGLDPKEKLEVDGIKAMEMYDPIDEGIFRAVKKLQQEDDLQLSSVSGK